MSQDNYSRDLCEFVAESIEEKKGHNIIILDLSKKSDVTDYYIIATVDSEPQLKAITNWIDHELKDRGIRMKGKEGGPNSEWVVIDYFNVIVHLFKEDARFKYNLESMWKDAEKYKYENAEMVKL